MLDVDTRPVASHQPTASGSDLAACVGATLEAALRARAPGIHASTPMVRQLAVKVSRELTLDAHTQAVLDIAVRVRDIGMLALPDSVVLATTPLSPADWELINRHPVIGERFLEEQLAIAATARIVRAHHERWDGGGYPDGDRGDAIPLLSRLIATCDAFVAIASDRPYRKGIGAEAALEQVCQESGAQFDPGMVEALVAALSGPGPARSVAASADGRDALRTARPAVRHRRNVPSDLASAIEDFDVIPALAPAHERLLTAAAAGDRPGGELVEAIEQDTGLTVAVLRAAQNHEGRRRPIANVADAVAALGAAGITRAVRDLPRTEFPWRTSEVEMLLHRSRVHAQAVARATDRITREVEIEITKRDDVLAAALLHDIGKLVLGRAVSDYTGGGERTASPEERIRQEQRAWGVDHASLGGLLVGRWGLPKGLASTIAAHHSSDDESDVATYVRLADMITHHAQGDTVDRNKMLSLAHVCGLSTATLRTILFDLPHASGSQRRRAERSPLSNRETTVLRGLAQGEVYKNIARELGISASTVRTHVHHAYAKLAVTDRAQAVLRATEMGWL